MIVGPDPHWYKDAVIYQVHVRAFADSNGDGIGDFGGLIERLDYLRDLGVTAIWLLPFYPSPLRDDGYDIADYTSVHPSYGTLADVKRLLREAHDRGLRVITELVINHTSDQHPWFQRARHAPKGSSARDYYVWTDDPSTYQGVRIIFKDFEASNWTWDPVAGAYYWHRFYAHQPDLNFNNPDVRKAVRKAMDFWFGLGVDGLRLDAIPYLHEREGTSCENLPETHDELKALRRHVDAHYQDRMLLAEANQWPEDAVAYFGDGDECHMAFHFPLMPRMFMAVRMEDRYPIIDILAQTPEIPASCQWAIFLRNHDELTLEMVTDEERDYMYRVYAADTQARINLGIRRRLAPLLGNDRRKIELMMSLLFAMPGTPVVYYGDEIGMGDNIYLGDRNGVRTPMQWSADRNAGFSRANPQRLFLPVVIDPPYAYESINVETQRDDPHSLLWWMRRMIALRRQHPAFGRGTLTFLYPSNRKVLAFIRAHDGESILVVSNLSRSVQYVELDLASFQGRVPVEMTGATEFPPVGELPYLLTLGPYASYWFVLAAPDAAGRDQRTDTGRTSWATLTVAGTWDHVCEGKTRAALEAQLPRFLRSRRWFGGKARRIGSAVIADAVPLSADPPSAVLLLVNVEYAEGDPETYVITLAHATGARADEVRSTQAHAVVCELTAGGVPGLLYGATASPEVGALILQAFARKRSFRGQAGMLVAAPSKHFKRVAGSALSALTATPLGGEQSNTSLRYGQQLMLKVFRRVEPGVHPDVELTARLTDEGAQVPAFAGVLEYQPDRGPATAIGILQAFVPNEGDAWTYTLDHLQHFIEGVLALPPDEVPPALPSSDPVMLTDLDAPPAVATLISTFLESARLLGQRTADMHRALAASSDPAFAPEAFTPFYQRSLFQSMRNLTEQVFDVLQARRTVLPDDLHDRAQRLLGRRREVVERFRAISTMKVSALRMRHHGDFHLGQVLWTGRDFVVLDFEGEPTRPLSTRRLKRSPLRDVAGMLRSFDYAARTAVVHAATRGLVAGDAARRLDLWAGLWLGWVSGTFLRAYLDGMTGSPVVPATREELQSLLTIYLLEKAVYELGYELNTRPEWVGLPLEGIERLLG
jgi:maltose alpha-D-glucosyltransferase/alpha-amylase